VIGNVSLWEVIPRSLATTFITLLPIGCLYLFGGDTLKDFAFALLVGIGAGAYSSIFIAAPLLAVFKEREPEYRRRKDDTEALAGLQTVGGALVAEPEEEALVEEAEDLVAAAAPVPSPSSPAQPATPSPSSAARREKRRQRRSTKPHGRAR
jgi:SecD/SecF fusion protein